MPELERCQETLKMTRRAMKDQHNDLSKHVDELKDSLAKAYEDISALVKELHDAEMQAWEYKNKYLTTKYEFIGNAAMKLLK